MGETAAAVGSAHVAVGLVGNPTPETVGGEGPHLTNGVNAALSALQSADTHWVPVTARLSSGISPPLASVPWGLRNKAVRSDTVWQVVACAVEETGRGCGSAEWDSAWAVRAAETGPPGSLDEFWVIGLAASGAARRPAPQEVRSEGSRDSRAWRVSRGQRAHSVLWRGGQPGSLFSVCVGLFCPIHAVTQRTPKSVLAWG